MHFVQARGILSAHNGMNIYRGCSHGCIYCDSRSECYQFDHPFEDIEVKENAPQLLEKALRSKRRRCMIATGSMSDPYMHCERELGLTRKTLEIIDRYGFGADLLTKSDLILRDLDLLKSINEKAKCVVQMTLTAADDHLSRVVEPNVCPTSARVRVLHTMRDNGIPTVVWLSPILPFIEDTEENFCGLLKLCFDAGVTGIVCFGVGTTLRAGDREYFFAALDRSFPGLKARYIARYGNEYNCVSDHSEELMKILFSECRTRGVLCTPEEVFEYLAYLPNADENPAQPSLF